MYSCFDMLLIDSACTVFLATALGALQSELRVCYLYVLHKLS